MRKLLKLVHDDVVYCKYYEVAYSLFHTAMRILEFCGLTLKNIDLENGIVNIDHQLQRTSDMRYIIETTKTDAGTRKIPITKDVVQMPTITPHVCRHTYGSNMTKSEMNTKILQYLMGIRISAIQ